MLLSIVMIIKNEEKHLKKTLNALVPLMKDIESELIILDTGSTDNSLSIAKAYTKNVYYSEWNNNFADMRNKSISYASGEWILILDADEELIKFDKLKKFFSSNLHKEFSSATIELKNIHFKDKEEYTLGSIVRMFKRTKETKYIGAIHEQPVFSAPIFNDIATFNHYGYISDDKELNIKKRKRNKKIILNELKKDSVNPYMNYQLGKEYKIEGDYESANMYLESALNLYKKQQYVPIFVSVDLIELYLITNQLNKCEIMCKEYIKKDDKNIDIYYYLAESQKLSSKYNESIENYKKYIYLLENYNISTQSNNMECNCSTATLKSNAEIAIIKSYYEIKEYDKVIDLSRKINKEYKKDIYLTLIKSIHATNKMSEIKKIYSNICLLESEKNRFKIELEYFILNYLINEERVNIYSILAEFEGNYGLLNNIRIGKKINIQAANELLKKEYAEYYGDILTICIKENLSIFKLLENIPYNKQEKYLFHITKSNSESISLLYDILRKEFLNFNEEVLYINSILSKCILLYGDLDNKTYKMVFSIYLICNYQLIKKIYKNDSDEILLKRIKNREEILIIKLYNLNRNKMPILEFIQEIKRILIEYPEYKDELEFIIQNITNEMNKNLEEEKLKLELKNKINKDIEYGKYDIASAAIRKYEQEFKEELYTLKAFMCICNKKFEKAEEYLRYEYSYDIWDKDTLYNLAYLLENKGDIYNSKVIYQEFLKVEYDEEVINKIKIIEDIEEDKNRKLAKENIEELININEIKKAKQSINYYKKVYGVDSDICSIEGIIFMEEEEYNLAWDKFEQGLRLDKENVDIIFNMAFLSEFLDDIESAEILYKKCLKLSNEYEFRKEVVENLNRIEIKKYKNINHTIIALTLKEESDLQKYFNDNFINIKVEKDYSQKVNMKNINKKLRELISRTKDCIILFEDMEFIDILERIEDVPRAFYIKENSYSNKKNYLRSSFMIQKEKKICDICDYIFTDSKMTYYFKKIIENRSFVYSISKDNPKSISEYVCSDKEKNIEIYYDKFEVYEDKDKYIINILNLLKEKKYEEILMLLNDYNFFDNIYMYEIMFMIEIKRYDLIKFIIDIAIKNWKNIEYTLSNEMRYKIATYSYELNLFERSYNETLMTIKQHEVFKNSPLLNRNLAFLLYKNNDNSYIEYYHIYKKIIEKHMKLIN